MIRFALTAVLVCAGALFGLSAPPASATVPQYVQLTSGSERVQFSSGKSLVIDIGATQDNTGPTPVTMTSLGVSTNGQNKAVDESHDWSFVINNSSFTMDSAGNATLSTGSQLSPYGALNLSFQENGSTPRCKGSYTEYTGTLKGSVRIDTNTNGWGKFVDKSFSFSGPNVLDVYTAICTVNVGSPHCLKGIVWRDYGFTGSDFSGSAYISTHRTKSLTTPASASRDDYLGRTAPDLVIKSGTLHIKTSDNGFTGRATISSGTVEPPQTGPCQINGSPMTQKIVTVDNGTWGSPRTDRLTAHLQITPDIVALHHATGASYTKLSYS